MTAQNPLRPDRDATAGEADFGGAIIGLVIAGAVAFYLMPRR